MIHTELFGYIGPDQLMPVATGFAAIVGSALIGWRQALGVGRWCLTRLRGPATASDTPDVAPQAAVLPAMRFQVQAVAEETSVRLPMRRAA